MSTPYLYWYPDSSGSLEMLDFGAAFSDLQEFDLWRRVDSRGGDGRVQSYFEGGGQRVRLVRERFRSNTIERALRALSAHLGRGGRVGFSLDHAKTWAAYTSGALSRGDTMVYTGGNAFRAWNSNAVIAASDEIVIESPSPEALREIQSVSSLSGGVHITISRGAFYTYSLPKMVRWRDFYPALFLPAELLGTPFLTHDRRMNWTFDITLEVDPAIISAGYTNNMALLSELDLASDSDVNGHTKSSLDMIVKSVSDAASLASRSGVPRSFLRST